MFSMGWATTQGSMPGDVVGAVGGGRWRRAAISLLISQFGLLRPGEPPGDPGTIVPPPRCPPCPSDCVEKEGGGVSWVV